MARGNDLPIFDYHAPLLSLPLVFGTDLDNIPPAPYLAVDPTRAAAWRSRLDKAATLRVGVAWAGRATHLNDRKRTIPFEVFAPLFSVPNVAFIDLQKERRSEDGASRLTSFTTELRDFSDTAALVAALDLVITVDTSVAHLAGALGKPVWTLLPRSPDWRWMLERTDTPWYPSMRLFRQQTAGAWPEVIARVSAELTMLAAKAR
jgi:hypothetical protein